MKTGGTGGALTQTGLHFEKRADLIVALSAVPGIELKGNEIHHNGQLFAINCRKQLLYKFLVKEGVDYKEMLSKKLLPDEALYIPAQKKLVVVEMKFQQVAGSVDEKLQTCDFKKKQYQRLFGDLGITVEYIYILNDWFLKKEYRDVLNYIESVGCKKYFNTLPLEELGLV